MAALNAKAGTMLINTIAFLVRDWSFDANVNISDSTNSGSTANFTEHTIGRRSARFRGTGYVQTDDLPNAKLTLGTSISTTHLTLNGTLKYVIPTATVVSLRVSAPIGPGETVPFEFEAVVNGSYTELA